MYILKQDINTLKYLYQETRNTLLIKKPFDRYLSSKNKGQTKLIIQLFNKLKKLNLTIQLQCYQAYKCIWIVSNEIDSYSFKIHYTSKINSTLLKFKRGLLKDTSISSLLYQQISQNITKYIIFSMNNEELNSGMNPFYYLPSKGILNSLSLPWKNILLFLFKSVSFYLKSTLER